MAAKCIIMAFALAFSFAAQPVKDEKVSNIQEISDGYGFGFELLTTKLELIEETLSKITKLDILEQKLSKIEQTMEIQAKNVFRSCSEEPSKISGKYRLHPDGFDQPFVGFCEQEKLGGDWLVLQHRFDGSVNFYRNWTEYKRGFGKVDGEFWLGLEKMHKLTRDKNMTLMIEIEDYDGNYYFGGYRNFEIGNETEKYVLRVGKYRAFTMEGCVKVTNDQPFSTRDCDNDLTVKNCAQEERGAWWYSNCSFANPNGPYLKQDEHWKKIYWRCHKTYLQLKFFRMMIK